MTKVEKKKQAKLKPACLQVMLSHLNPCVSGTVSGDRSSQCTYTSKGQATQPALPPTQAANERAPSERGSEAERQRG